ncbi:MAG: hypothetical protein OSB43_22645, partial [Nocardioides sp.]|nr:hypothetical protein [Nocardioides sp.]
MLRVRRRSNTQRYAAVVNAELLSEVVEEVAPDLEVSARRGALVVARTDGEAATRMLEHRASLTPSAAERLVTSGSAEGVVVADLIDSAAEEVLQRAGWSYWDRRGRLRLWLPEIGVRMDVPTRSYVTGADGPDPRRPVAGRGGVSLALGLLEQPNDPPGVREVARMSEMAASTISRARQHLMQVALVDSDGSPVVPELFWAVSDAWVVKPVSVDVVPDGEGWVLAGDAAAANWGAPALAGNRRYYCADRALFDRHRLRHGTDESGVQVAMAPTPLVVASATDGVAHPVVAALDLSTSARGREILGDWDSIDPVLVGAEVVW